ncbi:MAG TPA: glycosyltransferase family 39 protein [Gemmataceae bacterium]|nr:glycosyltransferase family 39 protein [Gemmataceae bacterium]
MELTRTTGGTLGHCAALYGLAVLARLASLLALGISGPLIEDEPQYFEPAKYLADGQGYCKVPQQSPDGIAQPSAYRMPGPALLLAAVFVVCGPSIEVARVTCLLVASASAPLMYLVARRLSVHPVPIVASVACALYPSWVYYSHYALSEPVYIPALLFALLVSDLAFRSGSDRQLFLCGLVWGLAVLVRPHALPVGGLIALWGAWSLGFRKGGLLLAGMALVLAPWVVRNQVQLGHPVLLATEGGETLLGSNNPYVVDDPNLWGMWVSPTRVPEYEERLRGVQDEVERDRVQNQLGMGFLKENPGAIPGLVVHKLWRWLTPVTASGGRNRVLVLCSYGVLLVALAVGALRGTFARSRLLMFAGIVTAVSVLITAVYWGALTRGRLPVEMTWLPWGALALSEVGMVIVRRLVGPAASPRR